MIFPCQVTLRGTSFRLVPLAARDRLWLCHEPGNPHDPDAVRAVTADGQVVGYLPAAVARRVVAEHGPGVCLAARVAPGVRVPGPVRVIVLGRARSAPPSTVVDAALSATS